MQTTVGHNVCNAVTYTRLRSFPWNLPEAHQPLKTWGISIILGPSIHTHIHESSARYIVRLLKLGPTKKNLQSIFQGVLRSSCVEEQHAWKILNLANHQGCFVASKFVLVGNWSQSAKICNKEAQKCWKMGAVWGVVTGFVRYNVLCHEGLMADSPSFYSSCLPKLELSKTIPDPLQNVRPKGLKWSIDLTSYLGNFLLDALKRV